MAETEDGEEPGGFVGADAAHKADGATRLSGTVPSRIRTRRSLPKYPVLLAGEASSVPFAGQCAQPRSAILSLDLRGIASQLRRRLD